MTDSDRDLAPLAGALALRSALATWTKRFVGAVVALAPPAAFAWYVVAVGPPLHAFDGFLAGIVSLLATAAVVVAGALAWFLLVARLARAVPRIGGGDDHDAEEETVWLPPRRGT
ncbi:hypothetical protein [Halobaculum sp. EA56]|uniref:hypothetical protein n=1 Tax=Halobaculum sp. EA56 TaxID=3421648 RepID=UPI003EB992FB